MGVLKMKYIAAFLMAVIFIAGCGQKPSADIKDTKEALLRADREFSQMSVDKGMHAAFGSFMAEDATVYQDGSDPVTGREDILELYVPETDQEGTLSWEPFFADAGTGGDIGYTLGRWSYSAADSTGQRVEKGYGYYVTIWKRQADGSWKYVFDSGVQGPAREEAIPDQQDKPETE